MKTLHLHLVSDASGETVSSLARACLVQFEGINVIHHLWWLVRTKGQIERVAEGVRSNPGVVLYTLVDPELRRPLEVACAETPGVTGIPVLDPIMRALGGHLEVRASEKPGRQHTLDDNYYDRIDAMHFAIDHDDGQSLGTIHQADVILTGVSRTSKTPTCMYLANRGIRAANVPLVPGVPAPEELKKATKSLIVGLTRDSRSLADIRRNRLRVMNEHRDTSYADPDHVREEILAARRLCQQNGWKVIDVTRRSIEEVAATILQMLPARDGGGE
ncbi:pyruvate, water dikinase regulatory protein [Roseospirillum parvum]|uniref:Putative pyruvate, phosphate dikinase regulatory protein n=1 Tax=Roseospirillum parvum TaxID=83401 RepID=A0A1G8DPE3_9PROT|nr:pyruvate, water dikinase regulatory protein [Roseospirillum parvum]SDH59508.1 hypothetical protein SAMN05421742_10877 [Roseospirillum parvum]